MPEYSTPPRPPTLPPPKAAHVEALKSLQRAQQPRPSFKAAHVEALLSRYQRAQTPKPFNAPKPTRLQLLRERWAHHAWLMYRREASIVIAVVIARAWHNFFITTYALLGPEEERLMACAECYWYVLAVVLFGAMLLVCTAGLRGQATELLAPVCGLLSGWAFKHLVDTCMINGQGGSDTPLSTELLFAAGCTTVSWLVMYAANFLKIHARVVGPPWSATAEAFAARVSVLLSNACGLGCAAAWYLVLQAMTSLREYTLFVAAGACANASAPRASPQPAAALEPSAPHHALELPSPLTMSVMFAASATTLCALLDVQIFRLRAADADEMEQLSTQRIQAQLRGWLARRRRRSAGVAAGSPLDLAAVAVANAEQQGRKTLDALSKELVRSLSAESKRSTAGGGAQGGAGARTVGAGGAKRLLTLHLRAVLMTLAQKMLGFVVGWAWFDAFHVALDGAVAPWGFACVTTAVSSLWPALHQAEYRERVLLTTAIGLIQGWAWSEAVDGWVVQGVGVIAPYGVCARVLGELAAAVSLSALLVGMRVCIARTHRRRVLRRLHRGGQRAWLMRQPSGSRPGSPALAEASVSSPPRQRAASMFASVGTSPRRDHLL